MLSAQPVPPGHAVAVSSRRVARRLLSGAGCAALYAYRFPDSEALLVLHALDVEGRILIAGAPGANHIFGSAPNNVALEVRLDISLEAGEAWLRITTASVHLLGTLTWLDKAATALVLSGKIAGCHCPITGENPLAALAAVASSARGRIGVIKTSRIMVHDALGTSGHTLSEVLDPDSAGKPALLWNAFDEINAQKEITALGDQALDLLCAEVINGCMPGLVCAQRPVQALHETLQGRVFCIDVAPECVTLMRLHSAGIDTVQVTLPPLRRACEVAPCLRLMVQDALTRR